MGGDMDPRTKTKLREYGQELLAWNKTTNLTGARDLDTVVTDLVPSGVAMAAMLPPESGGVLRVLDVGSGGGMPALPCAVCRPDVQFTLLEPRSRRVAFLRHAARKLGLANVQVHLGRFSDQGIEGQAGDGQVFDYLSSQATFDPPVWLATARASGLPSKGVVVFGTGETQVGGEAPAAVDELTTPGAVRRWVGIFPGHVSP